MRECELDSVGSEQVSKDEPEEPGSVQLVGYGAEGPWFECRQRQKFSSSTVCRDRIYGSASLLFKAYRGSFPGAWSRQLAYI